MRLKIVVRAADKSLAQRELTGRGRGRRLIGCSTWSGGLSARRRGGAAVRRRDAAMGLRMRRRGCAVRVRVGLRERVERLVEHVRRVTLGTLLKTASAHRPAQAA